MIALSARLSVMRQSLARARRSCEARPAVHLLGESSTPRLAVGSSQLPGLQGFRLQDDLLPWLAELVEVIVRDIAILVPDDAALDPVAVRSEFDRSDDRVGGVSVQPFRHLVLIDGAGGRHRGGDQLTAGVKERREEMAERIDLVALGGLLI